jgi:type IV secretion system protein VirD4
MIVPRIILTILLFVSATLLMIIWHSQIGFDALDSRWWVWLGKVIAQTGGLPDNLLQPVYWVGASLLASMVFVMFVFHQPGTRNVTGGTDARDTHGSATWATWAQIKKAGLITKRDAGVTVGGFKRPAGTRPLRHDGPEHVLCFAPTRSGKGVGLVLPTLLTWQESVLVLDIKGENYALSSGWRKAIGQRVLRFDPAAANGSVRYNPLAEVRVGTDHEIADCQNIASMIIDPDGKGLKDFWMQSGWEWLAGAILHVLYRVDRDDGRTATLADVHAFMSVGDDSDSDEMASGDEGFDQLLDDMARFDHGRAIVNAEIRRSAGRMLKRASSERSGVHSSATVQLALYSDPIVARNTAECDFRIADLMNGDFPTSLYIIIPPSDIGRLRPLIRILMNQFLTRLTAEMEFEGGATKKHYKHRLLLMLDEFTSIGKLEIFEKALAFMAGYGLKAFLIVQDLTQLQKEYGRDEAVTSNCHVRIAYAPNKIETAKLLSDMTGKATIVQRKKSRSWSKGGSNISESMSEVGRALMTPDECMSMPGIRTGHKGQVDPGDMLIV